MRYEPPDLTKTTFRKTRQVIEASIKSVTVTQERIARSQEMISQTIAKLAHLRRSPVEQR